MFFFRIWTPLMLALPAASFKAIPTRLSPVVATPRKPARAPLRPLRGIVPPTNVEDATAKFWIFLVFGNGGLGIGLAQIPTALRRLNEGMQLGGGVSLGGPEIGIPSWALLYPEPVRVRDVAAVLKCPALTDLDRVVTEGPQDTFLATKGYLTFRAFAQALPEDKYNKLAVRCVFDCFNGCQDQVSPDDARARLSKWADAEAQAAAATPQGQGHGGAAAAVARDALLAKANNYSAIGFFAFLIWLIADLIWEEAQMAFFV